MPNLPSLLAFAGTALLVSLTPGPAVIFIVSGTVAHGRRFGLLTALGVATGNMVNMAGAAIGLAALFAASATAFTVVKWLGAAYLVYLGLRAILQKNSRLPSDKPAPPDKPGTRIYRDGFMVALLNPKTTMFFAAFLPQFITNADHTIAQSFVLGTTFVLICIITDSSFAFVAATAKSLFRTSTRLSQIGKYLIGTVFIGLGLRLALSTK
ncbi:LysE family translocator [Polycladidibacter hongkongensis]|uniref:LysE family translocator n=1 Tax=Polycladidibacter hongkongensis TaxID=1647556 RepID=UPI000AEA840A|nr:LysE family translocator [Pseudovibrio hongkongensis]